VNLTWSGYPEKKPNPSQNKEAEKGLENTLKKIRKNTAGQLKSS